MKRALSINPVLAGLSLLAALFSCPRATATPITVDFTIKVDQSGQSGRFAIGQIFDGSFTFEDTTPAGGTGVYGTFYVGAVTRFTLDGATLLHPSGSIQMINDNARYGGDWIFINVNYEPAIDSTWTVGGVSGLSFTLYFAQLDIFYPQVQFLTGEELTQFALINPFGENVHQGFFSRSDGFSSVAALTAWQVRPTMNVPDEGPTLGLVVFTLAGLIGMRSRLALRRFANCK